MLYFAVLFLMFAGAAGWAAFAAGAPIELLKLLYGFFAIMAILCLAGTITGRRHSPASAPANMRKPDLA
jgi:TctA family transporter